MKIRPGTSTGLSTPEGQWNDLSVLGRKNMILENRDLFVSIGLVSDDEVDHMEQSSDSGVEFMAEAHPDVLLKNININAEVRTQAHRDELKTALSAVFLSSENLPMAKAA